MAIPGVGNAVGGAPPAPCSGKLLARATGVYLRGLKNPWADDNVLVSYLCQGGYAVGEFRQWTAETLCGLVDLKSLGFSAEVEVGDRPTCREAMKIVKAYGALPASSYQGSGEFATVDGWGCSSGNNKWPPPQLGVCGTRNPQSGEIQLDIEPEVGQLAWIASAGSWATVMMGSAGDDQTRPFPPGLEESLFRRLYKMPWLAHPIRF